MGTQYIEKFFSKDISSQQWGVFLQEFKICRDGAESLLYVQNLSSEKLEGRRQLKSYIDTCITLIEKRITDLNTSPNEALLKNINILVSDEVLMAKILKRINEGLVGIKSNDRLEDNKQVLTDIIACVDQLQEKSKLDAQTIKEQKDKIVSLQETKADYENTIRALMSEKVKGADRVSNEGEISIEHNVEVSEEITQSGVNVPPSTKESTHYDDDYLKFLADLTEEEIEMLKVIDLTDKDIPLELDQDSLEIVQKIANEEKDRSDVQSDVTKTKKGVVDMTQLSQNLNIAGRVVLAVELEEWRKIFQLEKRLSEKDRRTVESTIKNILLLLEDSNINFAKPTTFKDERIALMSKYAKVAKQTSPLVVTKTSPLQADVSSSEFDEKDDFAALRNEKKISRFSKFMNNKVAALLVLTTASVGLGVYASSSASKSKGIASESKNNNVQLYKSTAPVKKLDRISEDKLSDKAKEDNLFIEEVSSVQKRKKSTEEIFQEATGIHALSYGHVGSYKDGNVYVPFSVSELVNKDPLLNKLVNDNTLEITPKALVSTPRGLQELSATVYGNGNFSFHPETPSAITAYLEIRYKDGTCKYSGIGTIVDSMVKNQKTTQIDEKKYFVDREIEKQKIREKDLAVVAQKKESKSFFGRINQFASTVKNKVSSFFA